MKRNNRKRLLFYILISTTIGAIININYVFADSSAPTTGDISTSEIIPEPDTGNDNSGDGSQSNNSCASKLNARIIGQTQSNKGVSYHIYRKDTKMSYALYDYNDKIITDNILAGTSFGASLYEQRDYYWTQSCYYTETITYEYDTITPSNCVKTCILYYPAVIEGAEAKCRMYGNRCTSTIIKNTCSQSTVKPRTCDASDDEKIKTAVKKEMDKIPGSYTVTVSDPNDISCTKNSKKEGCKTYTINSINTYNYPEKYHITKRYNYELYGACINVKDAKVRYLTDATSKCKEDEIKIENSTSDFYSRHWHVFLPLNTKTTDVFQFAMNSNSKIGSNECKNIINKYNKNNEYMNYIKPGNSQENYTGNKNTDLSSAGKYGCYYRTIVNIPIAQKFYNEEKENDKTIFKGFAFYYRPIDINNPFPNGIASDSIWSTWENSNKKDPDLTKSFSNITYYATNINANSVRAYTKEHPYTSWSEMNLNGTSSYISSNNIITRRVSTKSFYNLGCGPSNKDWEECKQ